MGTNENSDLDLFGRPLQLPRERRGRPEHVRTLETSNRVLLLFAAGRSPGDAAKALGITLPTLRKHYFSELEIRNAAALMFEGKQLERLNAAAEGGNVGADKELRKMVERIRDQVAAREYAAKPAPPKKGKKEQRREDAAKPPAEQGWGDLVTPPPQATTH